CRPGQSARNLSDLGNLTDLHNLSPKRRMPTEIVQIPERASVAADAARSVLHVDAERPGEVGGGELDLAVA
ncbi:hypothetical protein ACSTJN_23540, partial [Vibrio parahaemolyticus]